MKPDIEGIYWLALFRLYKQQNESNELKTLLSDIFFIDPTARINSIKEALMNNGFIIENQYRVSITQKGIDYIQKTLKH